MTCNCIGGSPCPCQRRQPLGNHEDLLARAKLYVMSPKEEYEQRVSWVYGMLPFDSKTTKDEVRQHLAQLGVIDPQPEPQPESGK